MLKLYIAVLDEVPDHMVPVLVAHSVLGAHLNVSSIENESVVIQYENWLENSFRKVVLKVNRKEFDKINQLANVYLGHESTVLNGVKSCVIVYPREEYPNVIKFAKMWAPNAKP